MRPGIWEVMKRLVETSVDSARKPTSMVWRVSGKEKGRKWGWGTHRNTKKETLGPVLEQLLVEDGLGLFAVEDLVGLELNCC